MKRFWLIIPMLFLVAPVLAQEPAQEQEQEPAPVITRISGTLLGADGQPMEFAHVSLYPIVLQGWNPLMSVAAADDGSYVLETDTTGVFQLWFTGVHHLVKETRLMLNGAGNPVEIDAQLGTYTYKEDFSKVAVVGDFNDFSFRNDTRKMEPQADGSYAVEIEVEADTLAYQVLNINESQRSINGTMSDRAVYDGGGDYRSIVDVQDGVARIVFDPNKLMVVESEPMVRFRDENCIEAGYASFRQELTDQRSDYSAQRRKMSAEETPDSLVKAFIKDYDWSQTQTLIEKALAETNDIDLRHTLLATYLSDSGKVDSVYAQMALAEIEPGSPKWSMGRFNVVKAVRASGQKEVFNDFIYAVLRENEDKTLKAGLLQYLLGMADYEEKEAEKQILYNWLVVEYPKSFEARLAKNQYDPARAIQVGAPAPAFEIASLEDSTVVYSNENMKDQVYLIDFWAVWCGPCIAELPNLHEVYEKYKDDGFTILSFSFDGAPDDVTEYREGEWKMPWLHAFAQGGFSSDMAKSFQVLGIPKPILIGKDGAILATERDLRGKKLDKTLAGIFGYESNEADEMEKK